uniref:Uncharacterized protein n=1 Tax=Rhizophora mucronata TaxID=61149 RepID=A0A2P2P983_RHIMU
MTLWLMFVWILLGLLGEREDPGET